MDIKSPERTEKIENALRRRQPTLTVVLENIHDPHNVSAILRSCDAVGVITVHLLYTIESLPNVANPSSSSAHKWLDFVKHDSAESCMNQLHADGFQILATRIDSNAKSLYDFDLAKPTAIVLGNEHRGVSDDVIRFCDETIFIPMMGMVESLNVSVASAVSLFEAFRQRMRKGMYETVQLAGEAFSAKRNDWLLR